MTDRWQLDIYTRGRRGELIPDIGLSPRSLGSLLWICLCLTSYGHLSDGVVTYTAACNILPGAGSETLLRRLPARNR